MERRCPCCGASIGSNPVGLRYRGRESIFCSFGCAVTQAAPACTGCGSKVLGRGIEDGALLYCSSACRDGAGAVCA
jgi:hypothetical protein